MGQRGRYEQRGKRTKGRREETRESGVRGEPVAGVRCSLGVYQVVGNARLATLLSSVARTANLVGERFREASLTQGTTSTANLSLNWGTLPSTYPSPLTSLLLPLLDAAYRLPHRGGRFGSAARTAGVPDRTALQIEVNKGPMRTIARTRFVVQCGAIGSTVRIFRPFCENASRKRVKNWRKP
jgi:hypothetical protein